MIAQGSHRFDMPSGNWASWKEGFATPAWRLTLNPSSGVASPAEQQQSLAAAQKHADVRIGSTVKDY